MTEKAVRDGSSVADGMRKRFSARAVLLAERLERETGLTVHRPEAGMFALINVATTGLDGESYAMDLLENGGVAVMPGASFGENLKSWVRLALTIEDSEFERALDRIVAHAKDLERKTA